LIWIGITVDNSERIRKWREGRLRVAEAERAARDKDALARAEEARRIRQDELAEKREVEYAQVAASLPDAESIKRAKMLLQDRRREHGRRLLRSLAFFVALPALVAGVYL
jgi:capsular polysaccharide transport system permease protein